MERNADNAVIRSGSNKFLLSNTCSNNRFQGFDVSLAQTLYAVTAVNVSGITDFKSEATSRHATVNADVMPGRIARVA